MKFKISVALVGVVGFALTSVAEPNWLDDAWSETSSARRGNPSITVGAAGEVTVVIPKAVLQEAHAAGVTTEGALRAFLGKYGPKLCSRLVNLNIPQKKLKVELRELEAPLEGVEAFAVSPVHSDFVFDYAPANAVSCIVPGQNPAS
jgi:hypothetical protein